MCFWMKIGEGLIRGAKKTGGLNKFLDPLRGAY